MTRLFSRAPRTGATLLLGATLAAAGVAPAFGQDIATSSVRVDSLVVLGNQRHSDQDVINRSGMRVGNVVQGPQVADAIRRLFSSGDFSDVRIAAGGPDPQHGVIYIWVVERPYITGYEFRGLEQVK